MNIADIIPTLPKQFHLWRDFKCFMPAKGEEVLRVDQEDYIGFGAYVNGRCVGILLVDLTGEYTDKAGEFIIAVDPAKRRQGHGTALLKAAVDAGFINLEAQHYTANGLALVRSFVGIRGKSPRFRRVCCICRAKLKEGYISRRSDKYCFACAQDVLGVTA